MKKANSGNVHLPKSNHGSQRLLSNKDSCTEEEVCAEYLSSVICRLRQGPETGPFSCRVTQISWDVFAKLSTTAWKSLYWVMAEEILLQERWRCGNKMTSTECCISEIYRSAMRGTVPKCVLMLEKYQETQKSGDFLQSLTPNFSESDFSMELSSARLMQRPPERLGYRSEVTDSAHEERMTWNDRWILHNHETIRTEEKYHQLKTRRKKTERANREKKKKKFSVPLTPSLMSKKFSTAELTLLMMERNATDYSLQTRTWRRKRRKLLGVKPDGGHAHTFRNTVENLHMYFLCF